MVSSQMAFKIFLYIIYFISLNATSLAVSTIYFRPGGPPEYNSCSSDPYFSDVGIRWGMSLSELNPLNTVCPGGDALFSESEKASIPFFLFLYIVCLAVLLFVSIRKDILLLKGSQSLLYKIKEVVFFRGTLYLLMPFLGMLSLLIHLFFDFYLTTEMFLIIIFLVFGGQGLTLLNLVLISMRYMYRRLFINSGAVGE